MKNINTAGKKELIRHTHYLEILRIINSFLTNESDNMKYVHLEHMHYLDVHYFT